MTSPNTHNNAYYSVDFVVLKKGALYKVNASFGWNGKNSLGYIKNPQFPGISDSAIGVAEAGDVVLYMGEMGRETLNGGFIFINLFYNSTQKNYCLSRTSQDRFVERLLTRLDERHARQIEDKITPD